MNRGRYNIPAENNREVITLKKFCNDCRKDSQSCEMDPSSCLEKASIYRKYVRIKQE
ncbi:hypothetical protein SAMN04488692_10794 [Halarsenatibacter silvermanii]|uniref:Uncharacterized protein n=1 Tax=Halarsenatibacter silvermanii TaxID=321763 RepID=A0A1G9M3D7_9FIRM|nr:hypothetical protein SAMN04488692_10794 [Halarsenatibacter silvermanii]